MKIYSLITLTGVTSAINVQLLDRSPVPGVLSVPFSLSSEQLRKRDAFVDVDTGASYFDYIVNITVGSPPQPITLSLDTGSSDTILVTQESAFCIKNAGFCPSVGYYNANKSSSYKYISSNFSSDFGFADQGQGSGAHGDVATDTFVMAGATLKNQQFDIAYGNSTITGSILGLSYGAGESLQGSQPQYNNFPLALAKQGTTNLAAFSLWKDAADSHNGQILFGGIDTSKFTGSLTTLQTQIRDGYPNITAFDVLLNGVALSGNSSFPQGSTGSVPHVLDCGTSYSILPNDWLQPIYDQFNVTYFTANDTAYVDCDLGTQSYTVDYTFQNLTIHVPMKVLVELRSVNPNRCSFGLVPAGTRRALLGDNFLSSAYTVFDLTNNQISLAPRNFSSTAAKVIPVAAGGVKATKTSSASALSFSGYTIVVSLFSVVFVGFF
ncbi:hypothetical protein EG329_002997 [Mollisiaceae sp. DMI_Dod_QoI]|nr:hypothetical protein EG329_002997 [Helotiales sp. DMI_Dod_QoI]